MLSSGQESGIGKIIYLEEGDNKAIFNVIYGEGSILTLFGYVQESYLPDDTCFFYGRQRIYLEKHIVHCANILPTILISFSCLQFHLHEVKI